MAQEGKLHNCSIFVFIDLRGSWIRIIVSEMSIGGYNVDMKRHEEAFELSKNVRRSTRYS